MKISRQLFKQLNYLLYMLDCLVNFNKRLMLTQISQHINISGSYIRVSKVEFPKDYI